jgi:Fes/CIP4, and EFC/F-BAR homology domain
MSEGPGVDALRSLGVQKTEYAEALLAQPPPHVVDVLRARMRQAKGVNEELADFIKEMIAVEEGYIKNLQKLHRRSPIAGLTPLK